MRKKGSHIAMQKVDGGNTITVLVPNHKELRRGTLMSIIRQSKLPRSKFEQQPHWNDCTSQAQLASKPAEQAMLVNTTRCIDDEREDEESGEHGVELVEVREYPAEFLEPPEQALDLVSPPVQFSVVFPGDANCGKRMNDKTYFRVSAITSC